MSFFLFFYRLADRDLWSSHEARAAQNAQSILDGEPWSLPRLFHGQVELQKPPLYYWLTASAAAARGTPVDAWAVRLPAALAALACVLAVYGFAVQCNRLVAGLVAAPVLMTSIHFAALARTGRIDVPLTLTTSLAVGGFYLGRKRTAEAQRTQRNSALSASPRFILCYLAIAAGLLLKGPIGAVLPVAVVGVYLLVEGELPAPWHLRRWLRLAHELGLWWGLPLVVGLAAPWYLWADAQTNGELFRVFFWHHNVERGFGGAGDLKAHPWWFYGPQLLFDLLPGSLFLPAAVWYFWKHGLWRHDAEARFGLVWLLTVTAVLSCARFKRADYLLPAYPGAALFLGCVAERWHATVSQPRRLAASFGLLLASCLAGWWVYLDFFLAREEPSRDSRPFAAEVRRLAPVPQRVVFFRTEAHALVFHVGRPLEILVEWHHLDTWAARPEPAYVVMPAASAEEWPKFLKTGRLEEVLRSPHLIAGGHNRPLVLLRTCPPIESTHARVAPTACDCERSP